MTKEQALQNFWEGFGWTAYDASSVRDKTAYPYITYEAVYDSFGAENAMSVSLYDRSSSWVTVTDKLNQISERIGRGGIVTGFDDGAMWIRKGLPWAQRLGDEIDDSVRRIVLNVEIEYFD